MAYSYEVKLGDGATTAFTFTFGYLSSDHLSVLVDGVSTAFTMPTSSSVNVTPAPASDAKVLIKRTTPITASEVDFVDGSVLGETDLDLVVLQLLYVTQEAFDVAENTIGLDASAVSWDGVSKKIVNVLDPENAQDVATKNYVDGLAGDLAATLAAQVAAQAAQTAAETAQAAAETAQTGAETAETNTIAEVTNAAEWANKAEDSLISAAAGGDEVDDYSALHHANKAAASVTAAGVAQTAAEAAQTAAETAKTGAEAAETGASGSAAAAASSASDAAADAALADADRIAAAASAAAAATSEGNADTDAIQVAADRAYVTAQVATIDFATLNSGDKLFLALRYN